MSVANSNQWTEIGVQLHYWALLNGSTPYGTTGAIANGSSAGMGRLRGVDTLSIAEPEAPRVYATGDNGVITAFLLQPAELPGGALSLGVFDQTYNIKSNGMKIFTLENWDMSLGFPSCFTFADQMHIVNAPMNSQESTSLDEAGWAVTMIMKTQVHSKMTGQVATGAVTKAENTMNIKRAATLPWGVALSTATHGSTAASYIRFASPAPVKMHTFIGDNSTTTFTLDETPTAASAAAVALWQAGVLKTYASGAGNYEVNTSTKVVTMGTAPGTGVVVTVLYQHVAGC
jgi:hypothetical protein